MENSDRELLASLVANEVRNVFGELTREALDPFAYGLNESDFLLAYGRRRGDERSLNELRLARIDSRRLLEIEGGGGNPFAIGAAENRVNYAVGGGLKLSVAPYGEGDQSESLVGMMTEFVQAFEELNDLTALEREALYRADRDGEAFLRLFPSDGIPEVRFVEPENIRPPSTAAAEAERRWGIELDPIDCVTPRGYWIAYDAKEPPQLVDERFILHIKLNTDSGCPRGWPTFLPIADQLRRCVRTFTAAEASAAVRAKLAVIRKTAQLTRDKAETILARLTQKYQDQPDGGPPQMVNVEQLPYGSILRIDKNDDIELPAASLGATDLVEVVQLGLRQAAQRVNMPEWMFSGMADAKYSNAFVVESPALKAFQALQHVWKMKFAEGRWGRHASLTWRAARLAVAKGVLSAEVLHKTRVTATPQSLETRDKASEATTNAAYVNAGIKSRRTVMEELGLDPAKEEGRMREESRVV